jgi:hypothetical protein
MGRGIQCKMVCTRAAKSKDKPLPLVSDLAEEIVPPSDIRVTLNALRRAAIDHAQYPLTLLASGEDDFNWVRGRAVA